MSGKTYYMRSDSGDVFTTSNPQYHTTSTQLTAKAGKLALKEQSAKHLRKLLTPRGDKKKTVSCILRSVSRSGMTRHIDFYLAKGGEMIFLTGHIAHVIDYPQGKDGALVVGGCGMDMGFHVVHSLGYALWPKGTPKPHGSRNGKPDNDGGYAILSRWV